MIIKIRDEINTALDFNKSATDLLDKINQINEDDFIIDFKDVIFVTMNFAQAYYTEKYKSDKKISEINLSDEVTVVMGAADESCTL